MTAGENSPREARAYWLDFSRMNPAGWMSVAFVVIVLLAFMLWVRHMNQINQKLVSHNQELLRSNTLLDAENSELRAKVLVFSSELARLAKKELPHMSIDSIVPNVEGGGVKYNVIYKPSTGSTELSKSPAKPPAKRARKPRK